MPKIRYIFFSPKPPELVQHGNAVEQVAGVYHQSHGKGLERVESAHQQVYGHEFNGSGEYGKAHQHWVPEAEAGDIHVDPIGEPKEPESGENGYRIWKSSLQGRQEFAFGGAWGADGYIAAVRFIAVMGGVAVVVLQSQASWS